MGSRTDALPSAARLAAHHRRFLAFLRKNAPVRDDAEDILQAAYLKAIKSPKTTKSEEDSVAWFFRILRNAMIDHYRRGRTETRAAARLAREADTFVRGPEFEKVVCRCILEALKGIPAPLADAVKAVDVDDVSVADFAKRAGISTRNAYVRIHRGRQALKVAVIHSCGACSDRGCTDCTCC